jgi:hypothetical protein
MTAVLVLILAACSTAGGDTTTTTAPPAEPSTTATTAQTTTSTTEATTTTEEECVERDGVLRNERGFVCPPVILALKMEPGRGPEPTMHLAGTYETRQFTPRLRFTRTDPFVTIGESTNWLVFDTDHNNSMYLGAHSGPLGSQLAELPNLTPITRSDDWQWAVGVETTQDEIAGYPATFTTFTANCFDETKPEANQDDCSFTIPALAGGPYWGQRHGDAITVVTLDTTEPITIIASTDQRTFDTYWTEVAQPILDSIEFIDP